MKDSGDLDGARDILPQAPVADPMHGPWFWVEFLDRNFEVALEHATQHPRDVIENRLWAEWAHSEALLQLDREDEALEQLRATAEELEGLTASASSLLARLQGRCYAHLGQREDAIRSILRAIDLSPGDLMARPAYEEDLAYIHAALGDDEAASEIFDRLLGTSYDDAVTVEILRLDPRLDSLRDHPRFQALLEKYG